MALLEGGLVQWAPTRSTLRSGRRIIQDPVSLLVLPGYTAPREVTRCRCMLFCCCSEDVAPMMCFLALLHLPLPFSQFPFSPFPTLTSQSLLSISCFPLVSTQGRTLPCKKYADCSQQVGFVGKREANMLGIRDERNIRASQFQVVIHHPARGELPCGHKGRMQNHRAAGNRRHPISQGAICNFQFPMMTPNLHSQFSNSLGYAGRMVTADARDNAVPAFDAWS